uniref:Uncharacterized protein LOC111128348 isoform X1 n=1 Tax=Crassostrea virginica TaxID=6565 RepID=A0A8B8DPY8_CRAVI|nr:uncharacterized protein LOC111128348 isoform X1 [Crassostrea virginica]
MAHQKKDSILEYELNFKEPLSLKYELQRRRWIQVFHDRPFQLHSYEKPLIPKIRKTDEFEMTAIRNMAYYRPFKKKNGGIGYRHYELQTEPWYLLEIYRHSYQNPYYQTILKKERYKMKNIRNMAYYRLLKEKCGGKWYRDVIIRHYQQQIQETWSRLEKQKHLNNSACRNNSLFTELRIPPKGPKCTHLQRSPKKYSRTSIVSEDNQMDRLKSWSRLEKQKHLSNSACSNNSLFTELRIPPKGPKCTHLQRSPKKYSRTSIVSEDNQMDRLKSWSRLEKQKHLSNSACSNNSFFTKLRKIPPKGHKCTHQQRSPKKYSRTSIVSEDNQMDRLKSWSRLEKQKHLSNSACSNNSFFTKLRKIPPKGHKCTHQQRNSKEYRHTSIVSADNQMDSLKSESNLKEIDPEINLMHAPPLDLSSLIASNSSLQDTPQTSQDAEGVAQQDHSSVPQPKAPDQLPVPQKIACQSFGNVSSSNSNDRVSTDNHNTSENRHLSSSSDQRKGIGPVHDVHITSEESQFQSALRQPPIARAVCVGDPDYTPHTIDSATSSRHAPQPEQRSDRPLPQVLGIDDLPSVNLTNWFTSQQPLASEGTADQPQPIPTRVSMDQIPLGSSWNDVQKPFELFSSGKDESVFEKTMFKQPLLFWRKTSKTSEPNHALARAA